MAKLTEEEGGPELGFQVLGCGEVKRGRGGLRARFSGALELRFQMLGGGQGKRGRGMAQS